MSIVISKLFEISSRAHNLRKMDVMKSILRHADIVWPLLDFKYGVELDLIYPGLNNIIANHESMSVKPPSIRLNSIIECDDHELFRFLLYGSGDDQTLLFNETQARKFLDYLDKRKIEAELVY